MMTLPKFTTNKKFRLFVVVVVFFLAFAIISGQGRETDDYLVVGGILGALGSIFVILDIFLNNRKSVMTLLFWRSVADLGIAVRFLATYQFNHATCGDYTCYITSVPANCTWASAFLEFFEIASEVWYLCIALDLYKSLTNPFSSSDARMQNYHFISWTCSFAFAIATAAAPGVAGYWSVNAEVDATGICWLHLQSQDKIEYISFVMFYIPLFVIYVISMVVLVIAYNRLKHGISKTIMHRMKALVVNAINVTVYLVYWLVVGIFYIVTFSLSNTKSNAARWVLKSLLYMLSSKGVFAIVVWILTVDVKLQTKKDKLTGRVEKDDDERRVDLNGALRQEVLYFATKGIRHCASRGSSLHENQVYQVLRLEHVEDKEKLDLSPWFFIFLIIGRDKERSELAQLAKVQSKSRLPPVDSRKSELIIETLNDDDIDERMSTRLTLKFGAGAGGIALSTFKEESGTDDGMSVRQSDIVVTEESSELTASDDSSSIWKTLRQIFWGEGMEVEFTEFQPYHFRRVRISSNVTDLVYREYFETTIKERLTQGGASGAFFFFSKDEVFIAKSCTEEEKDTLVDNAGAYADYLESKNGQGSYISRIYGTYMLKMYGKRLYFYVMNNIFFSTDDMLFHEKYDIKGSTVSRSASPPAQGQMATCTHCQQKFVYLKKKKNTKRVSSRQETDGNPMTAGIPGNLTPTPSLTASDTEDNAERCTYTVSGQHEPSVIMKDNDLKYKIRLPKAHSQQLLWQLSNDADFLLSIGVMDYSLLVGVHNDLYSVHGEQPDAAGGEGRPTEWGPQSNPMYRLASPSVASMEESTRVAEAPLEDSQRASDMGRESKFYSSPTHRPSIVSPVNISKTPHASIRYQSHPGASSLKDQDPRQQLSVKRLEVEKLVGPKAYQMGIIDFQQKWDWNKKFERFAKINFKGADPYGLSAIEPFTYRDRFVSKIEDILDLEDVDKPLRGGPYSSV